MTVRPSAYWDGVYRTKDADRVSWYRPHLETSLDLIGAAGLPRDAPLLDGGGGASTLVDDLLARGFSDLTVLDVSEIAIDTARQRLGARAGDIRWIVGDVTEVTLADNTYQLWHDRAVFHFLVDEVDRAAYVRRLRCALRPGGAAILATFAPDGPETCSGLPVRRHSPAELLEAAGPGFALADERREVHRTPAGTEQRFTWVRLARTDAAPS